MKTDPVSSIPDYSQVYGTRKSFPVYGSFTTDPDAKPMPRNGSDVDPKNINWNLNRTLKVRQITSDLLEREAAFPVLLMGSQVPLTCGDCGDCCGFFGSGRKVAFPRLLKVV